MLRRTSKQPAPGAHLHASECVVEDWLAFLGHRWNALILWHLSHGGKRFGELVECLPGISPKVLTDRLESLRARDLVMKTAVESVPRGADYALTRSGVEIMGILNQVEVWSRTRDSRHPVL